MEMSGLVSSVLLMAATCISPSLMVSSASGTCGREFLERAVNGEQCELGLHNFHTL